MYIISKIGFLIIAISFFYYVFSLWCVRDFFLSMKKARKSDMHRGKPVSVLKPLKNKFPGLRGNFETFCHQTYLDYEIIIGTTSPVDPELTSCLENIPCSIRVSYTKNNPGPNYKVGNLIAAASVAKYQTFAVSDADMQVGPRYLENIMKSLEQKNVGLVTCLYRVVGCESITAGIEALSVQFDFMPSVLVANKLGPIKFAFGATIAIRSDILKEIGGFEVLLPYLADDYQLGYRVAKAGYKIKIAPEIVDHVVREKSWSDFLKQQLRWSVTVRVCQPVGYFFSFLTQTFSLATINMLFNHYREWSLAAWLIVLVSRYFGSIYSNSSWIKDDELRPYLWLVPLRDLFGTFIWVASFLTNKVYWGGRRFVVKRDGSMELIGK